MSDTAFSQKKITLSKALKIILFNFRGLAAGHFSSQCMCTGDYILVLFYSSLPLCGEKKNLISSSWTDTAALPPPS